MWTDPDIPGAYPSTPIVARVEEAAERLGVSLGTPTSSRRHGFRPQARRHVERFLAVEVLGVRVADLVEQEGRARSTVYASVRVGRQLARVNAAALGFVRPGRVRTTVG
jgi:hypothetical protein